MEFRYVLLRTFLAIMVTGSIAVAQITSNGTGGGAWNAAATWAGGVVPTGASNVTIAGTDSVWVATGDTCSTLTLNAGAELTINTGRMPSVTWTASPTSTVTFFTTTVNARSPYGNLIFAATGNGAPDTNLTVMGDLTITSGTLRGISATTGERIHSVIGNVIVGPNGTARISGVNSTPATDASCLWSIGGSVFLNGNNSGNRLILYESAGSHTGAAVFSIGGNLTVGAASQIQFKSSSANTADYAEGIINLMGNLDMNGVFSCPSGTGTSDGLLFVFSGATPQTWTGTGTISFSAFSLNFVVNNPAGVTLTAPRSLNTRTTLSLGVGNLTTSTANLLTIGSAGALIGGSALGFVNGPVALTMAVTDTVYTFPIGKGTAYRPATLTLTQDAATATVYTAEVFNSAATTRTKPSGIGTVSSVRYWKIDKGAGANVTNAKVELEYGVDDAVSSAADLRIVKDDGAVTWVNLGGTGSGTTSGLIESSNNFTTFGEFALGSATGATGVEDEVDGIPATFVVEQNYPNPFNPSTTFRYGLATDADVTITVYSILGQQVATAFTGHQTAGYHTVPFDASRLTSGIYLYRVQAGTLAEMRRMVLVK